MVLSEYSMIFLKKWYHSNSTHHIYALQNYQALPRYRNTPFRSHYRIHHKCERGVRYMASLKPRPLKPIIREIKKKKKSELNIFFPPLLKRSNKLSNHRNITNFITQDKAYKLLCHQLQWLMGIQRERERERERCTLQRKIRPWFLFLMSVLS